MQTIQELLTAIQPLDEQKQAQAAQHIDGLVKPLIFLTYCNAAARISSSETGGS